MAGGIPKGSRLLGLAAIALAAALFAGGCSNPAKAGPEPDHPASRSLLEVYDAVDSLESAYSSIELHVTQRVLGCAPSAAFSYDSNPLGDPSLPMVAIGMASPNLPPGAPSILVLASMHGDEQIGSEVALDLAAALCAAFSRKDGSAAAKLLEAAKVTIIPVVNPWGYDGGKRKDYQGIDLNRNFSWAWDGASPTTPAADTFKGDAPMKAAEARILAGDMSQSHYDLAVTFHSGDYCIVTPWDYIRSQADAYFAGTMPVDSYSPVDFETRYSPANQLFEAQANAYVSSYSASGTRLSFESSAFKAFEGGDAYVVCGSFADWLYWNYGTPCYTIELSTKKDWNGLGIALRNEILAANREALVGLLASAKLGASGRLKDASGTAKPWTKVTAVFVAPLATGTRDISAPVDYTAFALADADGYFRIALPPGTWSLTASGAVPQNVVVDSSGIAQPIILVLP